MNSKARANSEPFFVTWHITEIMGTIETKEQCDSVHTVKTGLDKSGLINQLCSTGKQTLSEPATAHLSMKIWLIESA